MCGFAGVFGQGSDKSNAQTMLNAIRHRGPDEEGYVRRNNAQLAHCRLSVIDPTAQTGQPLTDPTNRWTLLYNGMIYNYKELRTQLKPFYNFKTASDSEVLLAAFIRWGKDCLHRLDGIFSFVVFDNKTEVVFAARDRFGVKPFYYSYYNNMLYVGSEIKAIWASGIPREGNMSVWSQYLKLGSYGPRDQSFWKHIHQLPAGHFFEWEMGSQKKPEYEKWYNFFERVQEQTFTADINSLENKLVYLIRNSLKKRIIADVPIGVNLSGGLDSSCLITFLSDIWIQSKELPVFHFISNDSRYDEIEWVKKILEFYQYKLKIRLDVETIVQNDVESLAIDMSNFQDEPYSGLPTLAYSLLFKAAKSRGIKVVLDGQGMDEGLAGYDYYQEKSNHIIQGSKSNPVRPGVLIDEFLNLSPNKISWPQPFSSDLKNLQFRDLFFTKLPRALRFNDRISMMHGVELREPFLDYRLMEFMFALPDKVKIQEGQGKWLLRKAVNNYMGGNPVEAPKRPVQTPQREWLRTGLKDFAEDHIKVFSKLPFVKSSEVVKEWENYKSGKGDNSFFIWQWINTSMLLPL